MNKSHRIPLAKSTITAMLTLAALASVIDLTGCTDKHVTEVKALAFSYPDENVADPNLTVDQALDYRKVCDSVKWKRDMTEQHQNFVEYRCDYKGVGDSAFVERDKSDIESASDVYQWTYGSNGQPALSYVGFTIIYKNGTSKDFKLNVTHVMELAGENKATNFDEAFSYLVNTPMPVRPASPITKTTYGNALTSLYPDHSAADAAVLAYRWIKSPLRIYGIDGLGYPVMDGACTSFQGVMKCNIGTWANDYGKEFTMTDLASHLLPVDPKDVEYAVKSNDSEQWQITKPHSSNKLACLDLACFDIQGRLVGSTPASIATKEVGTSVPALAPSAAQASATSQSSGAIDSVAAAMASTAMVPPTPATTPGRAPAAPGTVPAEVAAPIANVAGASKSGAVGPDGWPIMTPCIQKLSDAFTKDATAKGLDTSTSLEQVQAWAESCKALGQ